MRKLEDGLVILVALCIIGLIIWFVRVLPYGNDWRCAVAECRITK